MFVNFGMARHGLSLAGDRVVVDVMSAAGAQQAAAFAFEQADEFAALHTAMAFS